MRIGRRVALSIFVVLGLASSSCHHQYQRWAPDERDLEFAFPAPRASNPKQAAEPKEPRRDYRSAQQFTAQQAIQNSRESLVAGEVT
ncbi:MAG: hypothetical protein AAF517_23215, partial [Planctomycetota bacterium]